MKVDDLKPGQHFWAKKDNELVMLMKSDNNDCYPCGGWEGAFLNFEIIELVEVPKLAKNLNFYYL